METGRVGRLGSHGGAVLAGSGTLEFLRRFHVHYSVHPASSAVNGQGWHCSPHL